ncbi:MAG: hypothetical protein WD295_04695, partial [Bacteroidota bacterium]
VTPLVRILAALAVAGFLGASAAGQTVTPATGGTNISADSVGGNYRALTGPIYNEGASGNAGVGTIILNAPTGFEFDTGAPLPTVLITRIGGNGGNNRNINGVASGTTQAVTSVTSTQITFTVSSASNSGVTNRLTWQNVRVRPTAGAPLASGNIFKTGTSTMAGVTAGSGGTNFGSLTQTFGTAARIAVTLAGQTFTSGVGNSGTPTAQTAGVSFAIAGLRVTDQFLNVVTSFTGAKTISYSGPGGITSYTTAVNFTSGVSTTTLTTTLRRSENTTITANDGTIGGPASSTLTVNPNAFTKLQTLVPGESAAGGSATGKTGSPTAQSAGTSFNVTVNAVDDFWNLVSATDNVGITSSDANATLPSNAALVGGTKNFSIILKTAGTATVTATDLSDGTKTANTSSTIPVNAGAFVKLQILLPGETADPGTVLGKTGSPANRTAGTGFTATVRAVDEYWNVVTSVTDEVQLTSTDANATLPGITALSGGTGNLSVTFRTAGSWTLTASDVSDPAKTASTSPSVTVVPGAFARLQLLVPGETAAPGTASGKSGSPDAQNAGDAFTVTVNATDMDWNQVSSTDVVQITSSDGGATLPTLYALVAGTEVFQVTLNTEGSQTLTASDLTNGTILSHTSPSITVNPGGTGTLTPASGGNAISSDNTGGAYTTLTGPIYEEGSNGNISSGTIILNVPAGFEFDTGGTSPTILVTRTSGSGDDSRNINSVPSGETIAATSVTTTEITFTITNPSNSGVTNDLTWQDIRVRPTAGTPLATGDITTSGTSTIAGVTGSTSFGTLTQVAGAHVRLLIVLPGQSFVEGTGITGSADSQTAGNAFVISSIRATDQFSNTVTTYSGIKTLSFSGPGGEPSYTT